MMGLSGGRKSFRIGLAVLIQYECDGHPASHPASQPRCRSYYAQRSGVEPKKCDDMCICLDAITLPALDRETEGRNWYNNIALCMHSMPTCDKNCMQSILSCKLFCHNFCLVNITRHGAYVR